MAGDAYPKSAQLARGERRYRRKVASPKRWAAIRAAKLNGCRMALYCSLAPKELHHVVPRDLGGDDVVDNLVCLCSDCHALLTRRDHHAAARFVARLSDAEYAYAVEKAGEQVFERVYGIEYQR